MKSDFGWLCHTLATSLHVGCYGQHPPSKISSSLHKQHGWAAIKHTLRLKCAYKVLNGLRHTQLLISYNDTISLALVLFSLCTVSLKRFRLTPR